MANNYSTNKPVYAVFSDGSRKEIKGVVVAGGYYTTNKIVKLTR